MGKVLREDLFWSAVLLASLILLSFRFLNLWFIMDDTSNIYASLQSPLRLLFDRDTYLFFNKMFYTPLLPISFRPDYMLFGLRPLGYHLQNMLAAFLTGLIGYRVYRLYLPRFESWIGTFLFVLSYPVITNIGWITRKHYLWGTFFFLAAFYFFRKSEDRRGPVTPLISCFFYLTALLFKEAFALFPAVVFLLAKGSLRERTLKSAPYFFVLGCYLVLRFHIIGSLGGYIGMSPGLNAISIYRNYVAQLAVVSETVWGLPLSLLASVFLILLLTAKRAAAAFVMLIIMTTAPFLFLKVPSVIDAFYLFYFPSKFMLPLFIFSGAAAGMHAYSRKKSVKALSLAIVSLLLVLQIMHAGNAYAFLRQSAESYRTLTSEALSRNSRGKNILLLGHDAIFYNFYYESYLDLGKSAEANPGTVITVDSDAVSGLFPQYQVGLDSVYRDGKWFDGNDKIINATRIDSIDNSIPKPRVRTDLKGNFLSLEVTDRRSGSFYGTLWSAFSARNIAAQSMLLPKNVPLKFGLAGKRDVVYLFYCKEGKCSEPVVIRSGG